MRLFQTKPNPNVVPADADTTNQWRRVSFGEVIAIFAGTHPAQHPQPQRPAAKQDDKVAKLAAKVNNISDERVSAAQSSMSERLGIRPVRTKEELTAAERRAQVLLLLAESEVSAHGSRVVANEAVRLPEREEAAKAQLEKAVEDYTEAINTAVSGDDVNVYGPPAEAGGRFLEELPRVATDEDDQSSLGELLRAAREMAAEAADDTEG